MRDRFDRTIQYLRISLTDRCNLHCVYCRSGQAPLRYLPHQDILRYEEIADFVRVCVAHGFFKFRLTGGEPLLRRKVEKLAAMMVAIPGVRDLAMTTNGTLLAGKCAALRKAGLQRINISLDTLDPERYARITGGGRLDQTLAGIAAAREAGLAPIKLNCVIEHDAEEPDARAVAAFAREQDCEVRFIRRMDLEHGRFFTVQGGMGGDCARCDRLRLSADGWLQPCLFNDQRINIREMPYAEALIQAVAVKPARGTQAFHANLSDIGG